MKLKYVFLISFLIGCFNAQSQLVNRITEFEDYEKCYVGFLDHNGDTLFKPQFNQVRILNSRDNVSLSRYWLVKVGDHYGVLSFSGEILVPWKFDNIRLNIDSVFITYLDGNDGIIDMERDLVVEPQYQSISFGKSSQYVKVRKGSYLGVLNRNYETIIPAEYETIVEKYNRYSSRGITEYKSSFLVCRDGKCGMINFDGTNRIPIHYKSIEPIWFDLLCSTSTVQYKVTNQDDKVGYLNGAGDTIVPIKYSRGELLRLISDTCNEQSLTIALMTLNNRMMAYNIGAKTISKTYDRICFHEGLLVYQNGWNNGVLDENFKPLIEFDNGRLSTTSDEQMSRCYSMNGRVRLKNKRREGFIRKDSLIFHVQPDYRRMRFGRVKMLQKGKRALVNYHTGKSTPQDYEYIYARYVGEDTLYWAINYNGLKYQKYHTNKKDIPTTLHIYNDQLDLIDSINYLRDEFQKVQRSYATQAPRYDLIYLEGTNHKLGAINSRGEVKIKFEHESHYQVKFNYFRNSDRKEEVLNVYKKEGKLGVINSDAELILPFVYDKVELLEYYNLIAIKGDTAFIYRDNFDAPSDTVVKLPEDELETPEVAEPEVSALEEYVEETLYVDRFSIKDGFLYYDYKDSLVLMDGNVKKTLYPLQSFADQYVVDTSGRLLYNEKHYLKSYSNCHFLYISDNLKILNNKGEVLEKHNRYYVAEQNDDFLTINKRYKYHGIYNARTNQWHKSFSKHQYVDGIWNSMLRENQFWVRSKKEKFHRPVWNLVDSANNLVFPYTLNRTVRFGPNERDTKRIMSGLKTGIINKDLSILIPPVYDYIIDRGDSTFYLFNGSNWEIKSGTKQIEEKFDIIGDRHYPNGFVVFKNDEMAFLDHELNYALSFTSKDKMLSEMNLQELLGLSDYEVKRNLGFDVSGEMSKNKLMYVNMKLWRMCFELSTKGMFSAPFIFTKKLYRKNDEPYYGFIHNQSSISTANTYFDGVYLSEYISESVKRETPYYKGNINEIIYKTYKIEGGKIVELSLTDLLRSGKEDQLDSIMSKELNRVQAFGTYCIDLSGEIAKLKTRFQLSREGITFYNVSPRRSTITLPYSQLEGILKLD